MRSACVKLQGVVDADVVAVLSALAAKVGPAPEIRQPERRRKWQAAVAAFSKLDTKLNKIDAGMERCRKDLAEYEASKISVAAEHLEAKALGASLSSEVVGPE